MQKNKTTIYFRTDGNASIGLGHFFRSLALAEMLKGAFNCIFLLQNTLKSLVATLEKNNYSWVSISTFASLEEEAAFLANNYFIKNTMVVLDGYQFNFTYQATIKKTGCPLIYISDFRERIHADLVINQAGKIQPTDYEYINKPIFCFGPKYALLQKAFLPKKRRRVLPINKEAGILICMGGADKQNIVKHILINFLEKKITQTIYIILGAGYPHKKQLEQLVSQLPQRIMLLNDLTSEEMSHYMQLCSQAICTPSTVAYEYLSVGGNLFLYPTANNQLQIYHFLIENNLAFPFEKYGEVTAAQKEVAKQQQAFYFDGQSSKRLLKAVRQLDYRQHNVFRKAAISDFLLYYRWINDPVARQFSTNKTTIDFETHDQWFSKQLLNANCYMYVLEYKETPIGQIRFDIASNQARVSYTLDKNFRGRGLGSYLLEYGIQQFQKDYFHKITIVGQVYKQNQPSVYAFHRLGFQSRDNSMYQDLLEYYLIAS